MFDPTTWNVPFAVVVVALFCIVMGRSNGTYWIGRLISRNAGRSRWRRLLDSRQFAVGARWINRWGAPAITLSFLTIGIQTMVHLAAGVTKMPMRRYMPAVIAGSVIWAFMYATVGFIGFYAAIRLWQHSPILTTALGALAVAGIGWALVRRDRIGDAHVAGPGPAGVVETTSVAE